ncbi:MAG TPA: family 1 encapsulin nanocompartment shell protein [Tissierellaceae bacterium]
MLYKELAPISSSAWEEIEERAKEVLKSYLSARKIVRVNGPKGLDFNVITEGRLNPVKNRGNVGFSTYKVQPLTECRVEFEMDRWELDNVERGAQDVDYEPLENAAKEIALFEENAIYNGLEEGFIKGIDNVVQTPPIPLGNDPNSIMEAIAKGIIELRKNYQVGPFSLVVGEEAYKRIISKETAYPLDKRIEKLIDGKIVFSHVVNGAYLLPYNHEDLELTIGRDFSIGYQYHTNDKVRFFITESFTFRVLDPTLIVKFTL